MTQQQIIVRPIGLITQPNKLGVYPDGAMSQALGCRLRDPGTLENALAWRNTSFNFNSGLATVSDNATFIIFADGPQALVLYRSAVSPEAWVWNWCSTSTFAFNFGAVLFNKLGNSANGRQILSQFGQVDSMTFNTRIVMSAYQNTMVFDTTNPTTTAEGTPRQAGLMPPQVSSQTTQVLSGSTTSGVLDTAKALHLTAIIRRKLPNGDELISAPSAANHQFNISGVGQWTNLSVVVLLPQPWTVDGDVVEIYRTRVQSYTGATSTNTGSDYFLSATAPITAAMSSITILDTSPDANLGEALYTNQAVKGASAAAQPPTSSISVCQYKSHAFYFGYQEVPQFKFRVPVFWGLVDNTNPYARSKGIGGRPLTGAVTTASPTMTGVSAADMVGVVPGQGIVSVGNFAAGTTVVSVTASTITFSNPSLVTNGALAVIPFDVMELNGVRLSMQDPNIAFSEFANNSYSTPNPTVPQCLSRVYSTIAGATINNTVPADDWVFISRWFQNQQTTAITVRATNGANYVPKLPEISATVATYSGRTVKNGVSWSEYGQPENVPSLNNLLLGKGEIYRAYSLRDAILVFASDGLWRISGTGGSIGAGYDWRVDPLDTTLILSGPRAGVVLRDTVFAYTNRGMVSVDSSGNVNELTVGRLNDQLPGPQWPLPTLPRYDNTNAIAVACDETTDEITLREPLATGFRFWVYNTQTDTFVQDVVSASFGITDARYSRARQTQIVAIAGANASILSVPDTAYQPWSVKFQPLYSDNSFLMKRWQQIDVACQATETFQMAVSVNNSVAAGTRTVPVTDESEFSRTSFGVPVSAPAIANNIAVALTMNTTPVNRVRLQGVSLNLEIFSEQRKRA